MSRCPRAVQTAVLSILILAFAGSALAFPSARRNPAMTWSTTEGAAVLFGGLSAADASRITYSLGDTWEWNGIDWIRVYPEISPQKRSGASMTFDSVGGRVILFGGFDGETTYADTWSYRNDEWTLIQTPASPPARRLHAMAFDPIRNVVVLYGGSRGTEILHDTWEFDGTTWRSVATVPQIDNPSMVWDEARSEILMLGIDQDDDKVTLAFRDGAWVVLGNETNPDCVIQVSMVFRTEDQRVLTYGGGCTGGFIDASTWLWDGEDWEEAEVDFSAALKFGYGLAYDVGRRETVLFGGTSDRPTNSTYVLADGRWRRIIRFGDPGPRSQFVFQPDWTGERVLFYGGHNSVDFLGDFWTLEGTRWTQRRFDDQPRVCTYPLGAIDTARERLVMICEDSATYEFDGTAWELKDPDTAPPVRRFGMMAYDPNLGRTILYGGTPDGLRYLNSTWRWDGTNWTEMNLRREQRPDARILGAYFFDPNSGRIILFGGIGRPDDNASFRRYEDQWSFNGTRWTEMNPPTKPSQRYGAMTVWDPMTQRILLYGGKSADEEYLGDLWAWDGTTWTLLSESNPPGPRMNGRMVWDPVSESILFYGGYDGVYHSDLWRLRGTTWELIHELPRRRRGVAHGG
ncbi:MAG: hypothetical protein KY459_02155 [Acidobacteria bacterium]|nr:hypothetical protein [Acidobacteriota bacterium]